MVSGLAPGKFAETWIVGNSTDGRAATGSKRKATAPTSARAIVRSVVATGLLMKGAAMFMRVYPALGPSASCFDGTARRLATRFAKRSNAR